MFTGYSEKELETGRYFTRHGVDRDRRRTLWRSIRSHLDFAVMGRYNRLQPSDAPMRSSANQALRLFSAPSHRNGFRRPNRGDHHCGGRVDPNHGLPDFGKSGLIQANFQVQIECVEGLWSRMHWWSAQTN